MNYADAAAKVYSRNRTEGDVACASPHRLIALLFEGVRHHVVAARQAMADGNTPRKGESTSAAIALLEELRASLDAEAGGELSTRLESLYEYMVTRLIQSNLRDQVEGYAEVLSLIGAIEEGWNALPSQVAGQPELKQELGRYFDAEQ